MFEWLFNLLRSVLTFWKKLSPEIKREIIDMAVEAMDSIFRSYYHANKTEERRHGNA